MALFAVVNVHREFVVLYKKILRDSAKSENSANQIHLGQDQCQDKEEQNCRTHTQKSQTCPDCKATQV